MKEHGVLVCKTRLAMTNDFYRRTEQPKAVVLQIRH